MAEKDIKIYLGADHRGFDTKEKIKGWLNDWGYEYSDMGAYEYDPKDNYTLFAEKVALGISQSKSKGVLICGSGVGVDVVANKFDGIRAAIGKSPEQVGAGRNDDDMNILVIAADYTKESEAKEMLRVFLATKFSGKERHKSRLAEIKNIEANN